MLKTARKTTHSAKTLEHIGAYMKKFLALFLIINLSSVFASETCEELTKMAEDHQEYLLSDNFQRLIGSLAVYRANNEEVVLKNIQTVTQNIKFMEAHNYPQEQIEAQRKLLAEQNDTVESAKAIEDSIKSSKDLMRMINDQKDFTCKLEEIRETLEESNQRFVESQRRVQEARDRMVKTQIIRAEVQCSFETSFQRTNLECKRIVRERELDPFQVERCGSEYNRTNAFLLCLRTI